MRSGGGATSDSPDIVKSEAEVTSPRLDVAGVLAGDSIEESVPSEVLDAAVDPLATGTNPLTLRFSSPVLERAFRKEHRVAMLRGARPAAALSVILVAAFGVLDAILQPDVVRELWLIRYGFITPALAALFVATWVERLQARIELCLLAIVLVAGSGIMWMILISQPPGSYLYYAGLILVIIYNYTFLRLRFAVANIAGWAIVATYLLAELALGRTPWPILVNNMFFFVSACVIGMFVAYVLESVSRRSFLQDKLFRRAREFGSYRLAERIGEGGMGEVWRAEHRMLARPAAIKLIRPEQVGVEDRATREATVRRFQREAEATAVLRSPHTVELYDFGVTDAGTFYYVMELLSGYDADSLVKNFGPVSASRARHLLLQVCESLAEAHEQGLIHRDIKPANIYVCRYGLETDFVKVLDFGIAKWNRDGPTDDLDLTRARFAGTPSAAAPEQISGDGPTDGRADLYSLGCVAYWLLTGRPVFRGDTAMQVLAKHLQAVPVPPSEVAPHAVSSAFDRTILACLEKDPARRPRSAEALAEMLSQPEIAEEWGHEERRVWWDANPPASFDGDSGPERTLVPSLLRAPA